VFKLDPAPTFQAVVQITVPGGESLPLTVTFKHMRGKQFQEFIANGRGRPNAELAPQFIEKVHGVPEGMTQSAFLDELFDIYPASAVDLLHTYARELTESRQKN